MIVPLGSRIGEMVSETDHLAIAPDPEGLIA